MTTANILGCRLRSGLTLPELTAACEEVGDADINVEMTATDEDASFLKAVSGVVSVGIHPGKGPVCRLEIPDLATFVVTNGDHIAVIEKDGGRLKRAAAEEAIRTFLLGPVLSMLCIQRGLFPLRGASVMGPHGAVICCGLIGTGKSTLAAALARSGSSVLGDDVAPLLVQQDIVTGTDIRLMPTVPRLKLWESALGFLSISPASLVSNRVGQRYYLYSGEQPPPQSDSGARVACLVVVEHRRHRGTLFEKLPWNVAANILFRSVDQLAAGVGLGKGEHLMRMAESLAASVPVYRLVHPMQPEDLDAGAKMILRACEAV